MSEPAKLRALVAEDSPTARALLVEVLGADPGISVVGEAVNGAEAVQMTVALRPDVVTMDVRMPVMDGLSATKEIMAVAPTPIVIVSASFQRTDVELSMRALQAGALAVLAKPAGPGAPRFAEDCRQLVATVKAMAGVKVVRRWRVPAVVKPQSMRLHAAPRIVALAASTGGPPALQQIFSALPEAFPLPLLVAQHIAPGFVEGLASWLGGTSSLPVKVAVDGALLRRGTVLLAPDGLDLGVSERGAVVLSRSAGGWSSATALFESVARAFGPSAVGVILTGMGRDGVDGLVSLKRAGGRVIAQDESTSIVFGMPGAAIAAGLADVVLPLGSIASALVELAEKSEAST